MTQHIPTSDLALYTRGDLGFWQRTLVERHLGGCEECSGAVREFVQIQELMNEAADGLPPGLDGSAWQTLALEMSANIRLGLAAGECVSASDSLSPRGVFVSRPRLSLALAGLTVLAVLVAMEHPVLHHAPVALQARTAQALSGQGQAGLPMLEASGDELMVRSGDRGLSVAAPVGSNVIRTISSRGAVRSRYVDETGVTIVNVYAE